MKQLSKITLRDAIERCLANDGYKVGVFCTTKNITDDAFRKAIELMDEMSDGKEWRDTVKFNMKEDVVVFQNMSNIRFISKVNDIMGLQIDEVLYHSILRMDRYGDTIPLLGMFEKEWRGGKEFIDE